MYFLKEKYARDVQATAGSAVSFASAELVEVASAAARVRGGVTEIRRLTSGQSATAVQRPLFNHSPRPAVAHP